MERYEFSDGGSSKFWEVRVEGSTLTVCFGKIGTQGQTKAKAFSDSEAALKEKGKLVREKTGKGYQLVSPSPETALAAEAARNDDAGRAGLLPPAQADGSAEESAGGTSDVSASGAEGAGKAAAATPRITNGKSRPARRLNKGTPLPTRTCPGKPGSTSSRQAWENVVEFWRQQLSLRDIPYWEKAHTALRADFRHRAADAYVAELDGMLSTPFEQLTAAQAASWYCALDQMVSQSALWGSQVQSEYLGLIRDFIHALAGAAGCLSILAMLREIEEGETCRQQYGSSCRAHLSVSPWRNHLSVALRATLVQLPAAEYQALIDEALRQRGPTPNLHRDVVLAFAFADDRPGAGHALRARAVLERAFLEDASLGESMLYLPLFAEAIAGVPKDWLKPAKQSWYFPTGPVELEDILATVLITAEKQKASAMPVLSALFAMAHEKQRTSVALAMLDTLESDAFVVLLPLVEDKWIRTALDKALEVYPAWMFEELLDAFDPLHPVAAVKTRLLSLIQKCEADVWLGRVAGMGPAAGAKLEALLRQGEPLAADADVPDFLRNPPWRRSRRKAGDPGVLSLRTIALPFSLTLSEAEQHEALASARLTIYSGHDLSTLPKVIDAIGRMEAELSRLQQEKRVPVIAFRCSVPGAAASEQEVAEFVEERVTSLCAASNAYHPYVAFLRNLILLPAGIGLQLWRHQDVLRDWNVRGIGLAMCVRHGEGAFGGFLASLADAAAECLPQARGIDATDLVPHVTRAFVGLKKVRSEAAAWFRAHPRTAIHGLLPRVTGVAGAEREAAELVLRWLAANVAEAPAYIQEAVAAYTQQDARVAEAVQQVLDADPLEQVPAKPPKLPAWYVPANFSRPRLKTGGALPDPAVLAIGEMLAFSNPDAPYAGIAALRECCTAESLAGFAWSVFSLWLSEGGVGKENWALRVLGWFGNDESVRRLTPLIRKWPGESAHARAVMGLDVLADIGSDLALTHLNGIAEKLKFKGLQEKAREKIAAIAEARDLTAEELADRLVPDFDLDARGGLDLDFGPRQFRVGFDEFLKPWVKDATGVRLKDLPKPNRSDDPEQGAAAAARWSSLKKDVRAVASLQLARLEGLLVSGRRVAPAAFDVFFARHPLIRNLAQRLVWGVYVDGTTPGRPRQMFRLNEELECVDANDDPQSVDFSVAATTAIGLVHPLHMSVEEKAVWGVLFGDYEIAQPFPQLGRDTYALAEGEMAVDELKRFSGARVEAKRLRGMTSHGWRLGAPQDAGCVFWLQRRVYLADGRQTWAVLDFGDGLFAGAAEYEDEVQTLGALSLTDSEWAGGRQHAFARLDAVNATELLRDLTQLVDAAKV